MKQLPALILKVCACVGASLWCLRVPSGFGGRAGSDISTGHVFSPGDWQLTHRSEGCGWNWRARARARCMLRLLLCPVPSPDCQGCGQGTRPAAGALRKLGFSYMWWQPPPWFEVESQGWELETALFCWFCFLPGVLAWLEAESWLKSLVPHYWAEFAPSWGHAGTHTLAMAAYVLAQQQAGVQASPAPGKCAHSHSQWQNCWSELPSWGAAWNKRGWSGSLVTAGQGLMACLGRLASTPGNFNLCLHTVTGSRQSWMLFKSRDLVSYIPLVSPMGFQGFPDEAVVKNLPASSGEVQSLGWEDPLE